MYRRINVTGNAGSGKSTLAASLGSLANLPVFGLDSVVWRPGWKKPPPDERQRLETELVSKDAWVIDGVSKLVREAADLVVFLDVSRPTCLYRCAKRNCRYLFRSRPGLPDKCPEILIVPRLVQIIWQFPSKARVSILNETRTSTDAKYLRVVTDQDRERLYREVRDANGIS